MPTNHYTPHAPDQTNLNSLVQALDTIASPNVIPELTATRSNCVALHLNPVLLEYIANAKTIRR